MTKFKKLPKKLTIFRVNDWAAIYADGKLVHWHDTPNLADFAYALGIDCDHGEWPATLGDNAPDDLSDVLQQIKTDDAKRQKVDDLRKEADLIEAALAGDGK